MVHPTVSKSSDETRYDKLGETERRSLDSCTDYHDAAAHEDGLFATKIVALMMLGSLLPELGQRGSPSQMVATAPKKQPSVYPPTVIPWTFEAVDELVPGGGFCTSISGKRRKKDGSVRRPPRTPWTC